MNKSAIELWGMARDQAAHGQLQQQKYRRPGSRDESEGQKAEHVPQQATSRAYAQSTFLWGLRLARAPRPVPLRPRACEAAVFPRQAGQASLVLASGCCPSSHSKNGTLRMLTTRCHTPTSVWPWECLLVSDRHITACEQPNRARTHSLASVQHITWQLRPWGVSNL